MKHFAAAAAFTAAIAVSGPAHSNELEPRAPAAKPTYQQLLVNASARRVTVKFREGLRVRGEGAGLTGLSGEQQSALTAALSGPGAGKAAFKRKHPVAEARLDADRAAGQAESGRQLADLNLYYVIVLPEGANAAAVAARLNALPFVEYAAPAPRPAPPPVDIPPTTPDFSAQQGYLKPKGVGVGALDPKKFPGADGKGLRVVDLEYAWRLDHEDLELPANRVLTGGNTADSPFGDDNHGTAVLGEIVGKKNAYGVTGITPAAKAYVAPASTVEDDYDPARAVTVAGDVLRRGDVLIIEQQYWVCGFPTSQDRYGPLETLQDVFDAVSALTARGVVVLAAAGNGDVDLDAPGCAGQFDRKVRDSGAIIVGAGSSTTHAKLGFSSYGSRVDVQGWGENVTTTGYGSLFNQGPQQLYTSTFNGTSSATPIVTGAAIAVQGVLKACGLKLLTSKQMRKTLAQTGTPQGAPTTQKIGPLPRILPAVESIKGVKKCLKRKKGAAENVVASASEDED